MARQARGGPERVPLTRERVLGAAVRMADDVGIERLTMRKLADKLGVEAMSLYYHVANKDEILKGIVDIVVGEFELPAGDDWKAAVRRTAISAHDVLVQHRWAANLMLAADVGEARLRYMNELLGSLRRGGFSAAMTHHAYHALDSHILGFTLWQVGIAVDSETQPGMAASLLRDLSSGNYRWLAEHVEQHLAESAPGSGTEFEFGLDLILDGLERTREA